MYQHLMIDLETLGVVPGCAITQIGVCAFNVEDESSRSSLFRVDIDSCFQHGLFAQGPTIRWWLGQSAEARATMAEASGLGLYDALVGLRDFYKNYAGEKTRVWSHGASFDEPILQVAAHKTGIKLPWKHWFVRDTRTLAEIVPDVRRVDPDIAHNAESDAVAQAVWVREMLRSFNK